MKFGENCEAALQGTLPADPLPCPKSCMYISEESLRIGLIASSSRSRDFWVLFIGRINHLTHSGFRPSHRVCGLSERGPSWVLPTQPRRGSDTAVTPSLHEQQCGLFEFSPLRGEGRRPGRPHVRVRVQVACRREGRCAGPDASPRWRPDGWCPAQARGRRLRADASSPRRQQRGPGRPDSAAVGLECRPDAGGQRLRSGALGRAAHRQALRGQGASCGGADGCKLNLMNVVTR